MTNIKRLVEYVKYGKGEYICSPQIGAGAGFDAKVSKKEWFSEVTIKDTKNTCELFDMIPLYNIGLPDISEGVKSCNYESEKQVDEKERRITKTQFKTPKGILSSKIIEEKKKGAVMVKYPITEEEELNILEYYLDRLLEIDDYSFITKQIKEYRKIIGEDQALDIQWPMQPYELLCFPDTMNTAIFAKICTKKFYKLMDKILQIDEKLIDAVKKGGSDFVFLGGPGAEMISPEYYETFLVPYSKMLTDMVHSSGMLVYTHVCSLIEPMLSKGYYNQMGIDLFETLSEKPVGNVKSLKDAFEKLDENICTRGNIGLDKLINLSPDEIMYHCEEILKTAKNMGRKHILAASDYLFYEIKEENVHAMCEATKKFNMASSNFQ